MMSRAYTFLSGVGLSKVTHGGLSANSAARKAGITLLGAMGLLMAGCAEQSGTTGPSAALPKNTHKVGVLLPLTGPNAGLGRELLAGAQLALSQPTPTTQQAANSAATATAWEMDVRDTAALGGASAATTAALAAGDGILLGPLTAADTAAAAPAATSAHVPVLAFTSDVTQAQPGVWALGISPEDQVQRLVLLAHKEGRTRFAALLPNTPLGKALGTGLLAACQENGLPAPAIVYHSGTPLDIATAMRKVAAYDSRLSEAKAAGGTENVVAPAPVTTVDKPLPSDLAAALQSNGAAGTAETPPLGAPPFDALLLGDTGLALKEVITALSDTQVSAANVRIMGPGLWTAFANKLGVLKGAWYAAPDPSSRQIFVTQFLARNHHVPRPLADLSYDAAMVTKTVAQTGVAGYPVELLTRPEGFAGVDGRFILQPNGRTRRALGVFEVMGNGNGARLIAASASGTSG